MMLSPALTTNDFFSAAYKDLGGKPDIEPEALLSAALDMYINWRNEVIERWAWAVYDRHGRALLPHTEKLLGMVERLDEDYSRQVETSDMWGDDEDDVALGVAYVVAVIRWYSNVRAERVNESLQATAEDAAQWLEQYGFAPVKAGQMSLFLGI